ncbi:hypothetical protein DFH29DRAFT_999529 [Suillus ampliporus]|nr:hypothetical protein DFH29DRAFT_999529 [Suillus ampliporus]
MTSPTSLMEPLRLLLYFSLSTLESGPVYRADQPSTASIHVQHSLTYFSSPSHQNFVHSPISYIPSCPTTQLILDSVPCGSLFTSSPSCPVARKANTSDLKSLAQQTSLSPPFAYLQGFTSPSNKTRLDAGTQLSEYYHLTVL